jgi:hypothetical protein
VAKFLLDANLSPKTASYLRRTLGIDVVAILDLDLGSLPDRDVVTFARQQGRVIITFDRDFAEIYHRSDPGALGVIHLQLPGELHFIPEINRILEHFFREFAPGIDLPHALVTITERLVSITPRPSRDDRL